MFHRAFHAIRNPLSVSHSGEQTTAVFGVSSTLLRVLGQMRPAYAAVAFDMSGPTFRHKMFEQYKAQRPHMPDEMREQYGRVREAVETFGLPILELEGFEADDVLGHFARRGTERGLRTIIVTGDQDTMQLVSPTVSILYQGGAKAEALYDTQAVLDRYGLTPEQIPDLKALQGDPSDNIPGVPGVGQKTATDLLQKHGTVGSVYEHISEIAPDRLRQRLIDGAEEARQGLELTRIVTDLPISASLDDLDWLERFDRGRLVSFFREMEFNTLINRIPEFGVDSGATVSVPDPANEVDASYRAIGTPEALDELLTEIGTAQDIAITIPASAHRVMEGAPAGIGLSWSAGHAAYTPLMEEAIPALLSGASQMLERIGQFLEEDGPQGAQRTVVVHVAREALTPLENAGVSLKNPVWDTSVAAHLLGKPSTALSNLVALRIRA